MYWGDQRGSLPTATVAHAVWRMVVGSRPAAVVASRLQHALSAGGKSPESLLLLLLGTAPTPMICALSSTPTARLALGPPS